MLWKKEYNIGVNLIDAQHKEFFFRLDNFLKHVRDRKPLVEKMEEIEETFNFVEEYIHTHFKDEELLQKQIGYPNYKKHREIHEAFKEEVLDFKKQFESDKYNEALITKFASRLLSWLIEHVTGEDNNISKYVHKKDTDS